MEVVEGAAFQEEGGIQASQQLGAEGAQEGGQEEGAGDAGSYTGTLVAVVVGI